MAHLAKPTANARLLEADRLSARAREKGEPQHAKEAISMLEALAADQVKPSPMAAYSTLLNALRVRQEFSLDFSAFLLRTVGLLESSSVTPAQKKMHRRAFAAVARKAPDISSDARQWLETADLVMTPDDLKAMENS